jgi:uncharacterized protein YbjT (DUF2867 family)
VPVHDGKHAVEERLGALGLRHAILAPVYFMENAFNPWNLAALASGRSPPAPARPRPPAGRHRRRRRGRGAVGLTPSAHQLAATSGDASRRRADELDGDRHP